MGSFTELAIVVGLTLLAGVFVAAEIALVSVRRSRVDQLVDEDRRGAARVRRLIEDPGRFLAVIQIAITFIGFLSSAVAAVSLTTGLSEALVGAGIPVATAEAIALVTVTVLLSLFSIVVGELVPKALALAYPDRTSLLLAGPVDILGRVLAPVVALLTGLTRVIVRPFGAHVTKEAQITADELKLIVERGGEQGILEAEEEQMINAVIELGSRRLHEVMVPRIDIVGLPVTATFAEAVDAIVGEGHSRIPIYEETIDEVVGILYAKDLLRILQQPPDRWPEMRQILRPPVFVPESMSIDDLLHEFQRRKVHLAIVLDEYGGTAGLATIEDLLEEIVGEIQDEYDVEEPMVVRLSDDEARIDGRADVGDLADTFGIEIELEDEDEYDTVGGLVFHRLGDVPQPGDEVRVGALTLTVESVDGRRVDKVLVVRRRPGDDAPAEDDAER
ncbi:MAG: hemolysin family protein [Chloroflexi bacterium]|nr:hemolysin family protein [Chloroflexota bacterium]